MPTGGNPRAPHSNSDFIVEPQSDLGGSPHCRASHNPCAVVTPGEVPEPPLSTRIEQPHPATGQGIVGTNPGALVAVAQPTGEPEILLVVRAARCLRDDVVDLQMTQDVLLRAQAISTAIASLDPNPRPDDTRYANRTHGSSGA
jgi:hypothetical protein